MISQNEVSNKPRHQKILHRLTVFAVISLLCLVFVLILYALFGRILISSMYEGKSLGFLNSIIESQDKLLLEHYFKLADKVTTNIFLRLFIPLYGYFLIIAAINKKKKHLLALIAPACFAIFLAFGYQIIILLLPIISSYFLVSSIFKKTDAIDKLNIVFLVLTCQIILITEGLSLLKGINGINFLVATVFLFTASLFLVKNIRGSVRSDYEKILLYRNRLYQYMQGNKLFAAFLFAFLASILWRILLIIYVPPNNWDAMASQLSRVAYWLQNQSLKHYHTHFYTQISYPINAQILFLWTMVASKLDNLCGFIQFSCYLLSGTLIYKCLRQYLKVSTLPSMVVMLIWYSLPAAVLQSTSAQNDMVIAYFIMFSLVYFLMGLSRNYKYTALSATALAIAIGIKYSSLFFIIPFSIITLAFLIKKAISIKRFMFWVGILLLSWLMLSSYNFIQNRIAPQDSVIQQEHIKNTAISIPSSRAFFSNISQHVFNITINQSGLQLYNSKLADNYNVFTGKIGSAIFRFLGIPVNAGSRGPRYNFTFDNWENKFSLWEDIALFGTTGAIMILLAVCIIFASLLRLFSRHIRFNLRYAIFAFLFIGYLSAMSYLIKYGRWESRFMVTMILIGTPMLALVLDSKKILAKKLSTIIILYSIILLIPATFMNKHKPLTSMVFYNKYTKRLKSNMNSANRRRLRYISHPATYPVMRQFESLVPLNSKVGILLPKDSWDYPLFGERLKRTIVPLNLEILQSQKFDFLVIFDSELLREQHRRLREFIVKNYKEKIELGKKKREDKSCRWILYVPIGDASVS